MPDIRSFLLLLPCLVLASPGFLLGSELDSRIDKILKGVPQGGLVGVAVYDLGVNRWLVQHQADQPRMLASTTKALVAAAALTQLGPNFQFRTQVYALGQVGPRIQGLGVIGGGDPCLDGFFSDEEPEQFFVRWADQLKRQGITAIDGDVVIDNRLFSGPIRPRTYPQDPDNQQRWYSAPASAFAWNDNCIEVRVMPTRVGEAADAQIRPVSSRISLVNKARTVAGKGDKAIFVIRDRDANGVTVSGNYSQATPWFPLAIYADPDVLAGEQLRAVLVRCGISVAGQVRLGPVDPRAGHLVIEHNSPLPPAVTILCQRSQNFYGEQILRILGCERSGVGSIDAGAAATKNIITRMIGAHAEQITILDGSGLSYGNSASAEVMVEVLSAMHRSPLRDTFYSSLKEKNVGRVQGRVKTGTLAVATCLVGYIDPPSGHRLAFALLFNRGTAKSYDWAPKIREQIYRLLADY